MGTELQGRGLLPGDSPEAFCLARPDVLQAVHADYCRAGADVLTTNTFGGTRFKLGASLSVVSFNEKMARAARAAADGAGRRVFVAGSVGPTGKFLRPLGELSFDEMVDAYREQIRGLVAGGIDLVLAETQFDLAEARAIVVAARRECALPVAVSMTYEQGTTLTGSSVAVCVATLANMGVDLIAMNCSAGPVEMREAVDSLLAASPVPVLVQPNAGLPRLEGGHTVFPLREEEFSRLTAEFARLGAKAVGGCCGTTPRHIAALKASLEELPESGPRPAPSGVLLTSRTRLVRLGGNAPFCLIGERINPTGKKLLTAELQGGAFSLAMQYAEEQIAAGARVLDVNVGAPMVDETVLLPDLASRLAAAHAEPLALDSSNMAAIAAALEVYPASPLVNSISGEAGRMESIGPLCRDFGAPFVLLPLRGKRLPVLASERIAIVEALLEQMDALGIPRSLAVVDTLALSISANADAVKECLTFIRYCHDVLHLPTICGLSNISFGLPARDLLNASFLSLAAGAGLSGCIANPSAPRVAEALDALDLLSGHDEGAGRFIARYASWQHGSVAAPQARQGETAPVQGEKNALEQAVINGKRDQIAVLVQAALDAGEDPFSLVGERLIPAITVVGEKYERKEYFLPQLIRSAETMQAAFALLRPLLAKDARAEKRPVIVMATVEGDIHDIGKNIVGLLLGNHGFEVVDLGKDVSAATIVVKAREHNAAIIGLSALMTTTMVRMKETVDLVREQGLPTKVLVGGAVVTEAFARSIGATYAKDAVDAVRVAQEFLAAGTPAQFS